MRKLIITISTLLLSLSLFPTYAKTPTLEINIASDNAFVIDITDHQILYDKDSEEIIFPASMTKMMTAIVAIENIEDLSEKTFITQPMIEGLIEADASMAGFRAGDVVSALDLLYGLALPSGADACNALAIKISGSIESFVELMNQKAKSLGMANTHFMNTTGLHDDNHYSTCRDIATLLEYCIQNETFQKVFSTVTHTTEPTTLFPEGIELHSSSLYYIQEANINIPGLIGGKTGYTGPAGRSLASWAELNDMKIITVVAQGMSDEPCNIFDTKIVLDSLNNWSKKTLLREGEILKEVFIEHRYSKDKIVVASGDTIIMDVPNDANITRELDIVSNIESSLEPVTFSSPFIIKVNDEVIYEKYINITVPREKSFFARLIKRIKNLFS